MCRWKKTTQVLLRLVVHVYCSEGEPPHVYGKRKYIPQNNSVFVMKQEIFFIHIRRNCEGSCIEQLGFWARVQGGFLFKKNMMKLQQFYLVHSYCMKLSLYICTTITPVLILGMVVFFFLNEKTIGLMLIGCLFGMICDTRKHDHLFQYITLLRNMVMIKLKG